MDPPGARKVPLAEIAAAARVSEATVSRVLNRRYGVAPKTRDAVEQAVRELRGQRPLAGQLVMLLSPNLTNSYFTRLGACLQQELLPHGLRTVFCPIDGEPDEREYVAAMAESGIAAAVFLSSNTLARADKTPADVLTSRGVPFVMINGSFADVSGAVFATDEHAVSRISVEHLTLLGHRRIGMVAGPVGNIPADRRAEGFAIAMADAGLEGRLERREYSLEGGYDGGSHLIRDGVTAVVAGSDEMALGVLEAARSLSRRVPHDLSIIGFDDNPYLQFTTPPLTTVHPPMEEIAAATAHAIVSMVGGAPSRGFETRFAPRLVVRESTAPPSEPEG